MRNYVTDAREALIRAKGDSLGEFLTPYTLLVLVTGEDTTSKHVHDAWAIQTDASRPEHKSLVPFDFLRPEVQSLDDEYRDAIREAARAIRDAASGITGP